MSIDYTPIKEIKKSDFDFNLFNSNQPVVIRGLVDDWPLVQASSSSIEDLISHILCYYEGDRVLAFASTSESGNKFTYANTETKKSFSEIYLDTSSKEKGLSSWPSPPEESSTSRTCITT